MDPELKAYLEGMRQDLMAHAERLNGKTNQWIDTVDQGIRKTRVLIGDVGHDVQGVADGVLTVNQKLDRYIAETDLRITRLERRVP